eukprot:TRINITY_DN4208_c0_g1_i1.p1 TRINITY_DN4208_c0_g1~~TRINITY_DN4208_c0_g1_i1.p1  ORF type:complete len:581 (+),score=116.68 TRINITY_DN4208_c0_g1_i1:67-1743(+)
MADTCRALRVLVPSRHLGEALEDVDEEALKLEQEKELEEAECRKRVLRVARRQIWRERIRQKRILQQAFQESGNVTDESAEIITNQVEATSARMVKQLKDRLAAMDEEAQELVANIGRSRGRYAVLLEEQDKVGDELKVWGRAVVSLEAQAEARGRYVQASRTLQSFVSPPPSAGRSVVQPSSPTFLTPTIPQGISSSGGLAKVTSMPQLPSGKTTPVTVSYVWSDPLHASTTTTPLSSSRNMGWLSPHSSNQYQRTMPTMVSPGRVSNSPAPPVVPQGLSSGGSVSSYQGWPASGGSSARRQTSLERVQVVSPPAGISSGGSISSAQVRQSSLERTPGIVVGSPPRGVSSNLGSARRQSSLERSPGIVVGVQSPVPAGISSSGQVRPYAFGSSLTGSPGPAGHSSARRPSSLEPPVVRGTAVVRYASPQPSGGSMHLPQPQQMSPTPLTTTAMPSPISTTATTTPVPSPTPTTTTTITATAAIPVSSSGGPRSPPGATTTTTKMMASPSSFRPQSPLSSSVAAAPRTAAGSMCLSPAGRSGAVQAGSPRVVTYRPLG